MIWWSVKLLSPSAHDKSELSYLYKGTVNKYSKVAAFFYVYSATLVYASDYRKSPQFFFSNILRASAMEVPR